MGRVVLAKTTAFCCGLALMGADQFRLYRDLSPAKVLQLCSVTSIPLGVDDPDSKGSFSKMELNEGLFPCLKVTIENT